MYLNAKVGNNLASVGYEFPMLLPILCFSGPGTLMFYNYRDTVDLG